MNGYEYEEYCANYLKKNGYTDITVTKGSGDHGVDIIACKNGKKYAIQCKYYSNPVSNAAVQQVYTGCVYYQCDIPMVITNNHFTAQAKEEASKVGVVLNDFIIPPTLSDSTDLSTSFSRRPSYSHPVQDNGYAFNILGFVITIFFSVLFLYFAVRPPHKTWKLLLFLIGISMIYGSRKYIRDFRKYHEGKYARALGKLVKKYFRKNGCFCKLNNTRCINDHIVEYYYICPIERQISHIIANQETLALFVGHPVSLAIKNTTGLVLRIDLDESIA